MKSFFPTRLAEIIYALVMGIFGVLHFMNADTMSGMIPEFMPADGKIWIYITGAAFIAAALAIIINKFKTPACYLLALMLLVSPRSLCDSTVIFSSADRTYAP